MTLVTGGCLPGYSTAPKRAVSPSVRMIGTAMTRAGSMPPVARGPVQTFSVSAARGVIPTGSPVQACAAPVIVLRAKAIVP